MPQCQAHPTSLQFVILVKLPKLASHYLKPLENLLDDTRSSSFGVWLVVNGAAARSLSDRENRPRAQRAANSEGQSQMIADMQTPPKTPALTSFNMGTALSLTTAMVCRRPLQHRSLPTFYRLSILCRPYIVTGHTVCK